MALRPDLAIGLPFSVCPAPKEGPASGPSLKIL
jgi:hypothetical protein